MRRYSALLLALLALPQGAPVRSQTTTAQPASGSALSELLAAANPPERAAGHKPEFHAELEELPVPTSEGVQPRPFYVVRDGKRAIAVVDLEQRWIELVARLPATAPEKPIPVAQPGHAGLFGPRLTPRLGVPEDEAGGSRDLAMLPHGENRLVVLIREEWPAKQKLAVAYHLEPRVDPRLGYVWDVAVQITNTALKTPERLLSFATLSAPGGGSMWPAPTQADRTAYTPTLLKGWQSWWNNAGSVTAMPKKDEFLNVRPQGGACLLGPDGWATGLAFSEMGSMSVHLRTGVLWEESIAYARLPLKEPEDSRQALTFRFVFHGLPPEVADHLRKSAVIATLEGHRSFLLRLGSTDDLEQQPLSIGSAVRGVPAPRWTLTQAQAHSGKKSAAVVGTLRNRRIPAEAGRLGRLIPLPSGDYRLEAWIKVVGADGEAYLLADRYDSVDPAGLPAGSHRGRHRTPSIRAGDWQRVSLDLPAGPNGTHLDLRLIVLGNATGYLDDFNLAPKPQ